MIRDYFNPVKIKIGQGSVNKLPELLGKQSAVLITTKGMVNRGTVDRIKKLCGPRLLQVSTAVQSNPTIASINKCFSDLEDYNYDVIIGLGGGSAIDTAKAVAVLCGGSVSRDWLDGYCRHDEKKPEVLKTKPIMAIPTTSGTGSEVTKWATVWDEATGAKYSISDERLYPEYGILDPELTDSLPYETTLFSALDALSHAMEAIWNKNSNPVSDVLAAKAIDISTSILADNFKEKYSQQKVREILQHASLLAGLAFSNTKTALAHSISYPFTSKFKIPHGLACSFTLPEIMRVNYKHDRERVNIILQVLKCSVIDNAIEILYKIFKDVGTSEYLRQFFNGKLDLALLADSLITPGRAENNIISVSQDDAIEVVRAAISGLEIN